MRSYIYGMMINIQFFSTIPLRKEIPMTKKNVERAIQLFPLLGIFQGLIYSGVVYSFIHWTAFSPLAIAFILWMLLIGLTGGIHLDGWIDCNDAFFSYQDQSKRLEVMNDPRVGSFGVIGLIILLSARLLFIYEIMMNIEYWSYLLIVFIPFLGKMFMGTLLMNVPTAKETGLAHFFQRASTRQTMWSYPVYIVIAVIAIFFWQPDYLLAIGIMILVIGLLFLYARKKVMAWFGGITGDTVGASTEGLEVLLWMIVWLFHYYGMG